MTRAITNAWSASANNTADFERCIEEGTFGLNDTVIQAWATGKKLTGPEFWTSDVSLPCLADVTPWILMSNWV